MRKIISTAIASLALILPTIGSPAAPLNILLITADDLGYEAVDFLGGKVPDVTPNLDKLASQGMSFAYGYNNAAICVPSRGVIGTGRYSHNSGVIGFNKMTGKIPTIFGTFKAAGYLTGVLGKVSHSTPDPDFRWDFVHEQAELGAGRSPTIYGNYAREFFARCKKENKPFYFMVNSHDPHRPFHDPGKPVPGSEKPSRIFSPGEIAVPPYLPDLPGVRTELSHYYNSVRRFDDTLGRVLQALAESGQAENTLVVMLSDNGSAFPFAKANAYFASNHTPFLVRWPGVIRPASVDRTHLVSEVDFFPTFMDAAGLPPPAGLDGQSLLPLLRGEGQPNRDYVFTQIDYKAGKASASPMRCIQDKQYAYIFNAWSDGTYWYRNNNEGMTMKAMQDAGKSDPAIQARVDLFRHRVPQEFYCLATDPGCTNNLMSSPEHKELIKKFQDRLRLWMVQTHDHCLPAFDARENPAQLAAAMKQYPKIRGPVLTDEATEGGVSPGNETGKAKGKRGKKKSAAQE